VGDETIDKVRNNAFLFARQILIQGKAVSYAEQFQGMYALIVAWFPCSHWVLLLAWVGGRCGQKQVPSLRRTPYFGATVLTLVNISAVLLRKISDPLTKHKVELGYAFVLFFALLAIGYVLGIRYPARPQSALLAFLAAWH